MPGNRRSNPARRAALGRLDMVPWLNMALWLAAAGMVLALGACGPDRQSGYTDYPDRWEFRQDPSDNYGRIYRY